MAIAIAASSVYGTAMRLTGALLIIFAAFTLALGISQPLLVMERLFFLEDTPSLIDIVAGLANTGDWLLAAIVAIVSILFPMAKLVFIQRLLVQPHADAAEDDRWHRWLGFMSKWSMMDVVLVALAIFAAKTSGLATALSQAGLWFYAASAISGAIASNLLSRQGN